MTSARQILSVSLDICQHTVPSRVTGGKYTGAALNPARVIGPLAVFKCGANIFWIYLLAQIVAAVGACAIFAFVSGWGPLMPFKAKKEYGMSQAEAMKMWITGEEAHWGVLLEGKRGLHCNGR